MEAVIENLPTYWRGFSMTLLLLAVSGVSALVLGTIIAAMIPIAFLLSAFAQSGPIASAGGLTISLSILYILGAGVVIASVCGYMAGLIGASNSPVSGVGILAIVIAVAVRVFGKTDGGTWLLVFMVRISR